MGVPLTPLGLLIALDDMDSAPCDTDGMGFLSAVPHSKLGVSKDLGYVFGLFVQERSILVGGV